MELQNDMMSDEQAIRMMRDFVTSQEKLQEQRAHATAIGGTAPRYNHYTSAETALENLTNLLMG